MAKRKWYDNPVGKEEVGEYRDALPSGPVKGRGAALNPGNRFENVRLHVLGEHLDEIARDADGVPTQVKTQVIPDNTQSIINRVQFPDIGFDWTLNPYRGCEHGCVYCYARPYHEYLGFSSGIDFETRIVAKLDAPKLLVKELAKPSWQAETIVMSAITDCWQPLEEELRITRACLGVLAKARQPVAMLTRSRRILRDLDLIGELAQHGVTNVAVTITTLDAKLAAAMEPRASSPADRLHAMRELSKAGVPVTAMIAPTIPGLTDRELPKLLEAIADAGASNAQLCMIRLPYQNKAMFFDWLSRKYPDRAGHVESLLRDVYDGKLYDADMAMRARGKGQIAEQISGLFKVFRKRYGLDKPFPTMNRGAFRRPSRDGQLGLFE